MTSNRPICTWPSSTNAIQLRINERSCALEVVRVAYFWRRPARNRTSARIFGANVASSTYSVGV